MNNKRIEISSLSIILEKLKKRAVLWDSTIDAIGAKQQTKVEFLRKWKGTVDNEIRQDCKETFEG